MSDYYILRPDRTPDGPFPVELLRAMLARGEITPQTHCCQAGATQWGTIAQLIPAEPGAGAPPVPPPPPPISSAYGAVGPAPGVPAAATPAGAGFMGQFSKALAGHGAEAAGLAQVFARRILASNFTKEKAAEEEIAALKTASLPIEYPLGQNYAAWRRAVLWFSGVGLAVASLSQVVDTVKGIFGEGTPFAVRIIIFLLFLFQAGAAFLALWGAWRWSEVRESRRAARFAYFCQLLGPLLLFAIPIRWLVSGNPQELYAVGAGFALIAVVVLLPKIFGLFPGLMRACLTLRTMVPESPMPGWVCVIVAPLYSLFFAIVVIIAAQAGSFWLFLGFFILLLAPLFVVADAGNLCRPAGEEEMNRTLAALRWRMFLASTTGIVIVLLACIPLFRQMSLSVISIISFLSSLVGNVFLVTVVASDFLLGLMRRGFEQEEELRASPLHAVLQERFAQLGNVRMADMSAGESMVIANVGELLRRARGGKG